MFQRLKLIDNNLIHIYRTESKSLPCSPLTRVDITEKLERAEARREELLKLRKENIDQKLALAQERKDELLKEKAEKAKEVNTVTSLN